MSISTLNLGYTGAQGIPARHCQLVCTNTLSQVEAVGFVPASFNVQPTDIFDVWYGANSASYGVFTTSRDADGEIVLTASVTPGDVTLPVVSGDIAIFDGTAGTIKDSGYAPSAATGAGRTKLAAVQGAPSVGTIAVFADVNGTVQDTTTGIASHLGAIQSGAFTGTQGIFIASAPSNSKGSFQMRGTNNVGNTDTILTNASMAQATTISIADPGQSTATIPVQTGAIVSGNIVKAGGNAGTLIDAGYQFTSKKTASWGGGGTTHSFTALDVTTSSNIVVSLVSSANVVAFKAIAGAGTIDVTFASDPGAGTVMAYMATTVVV